MATMQGIYVALFGRPADPAGLSFFNGITGNGQNLTAIANLAGQKEYLDRFTGMTDSQIVSSLYKSLFGRDPEASGLNFWTEQLANKTYSINNIAVGIINGALGADKDVVNAKVAAADLFTSHLDLAIEQQAYGNPPSNVQLAKDYITSINTSHLGSAAEVDAIIARMLLNAGQAPAEGSSGGGATPGTTTVVGPGHAPIVFDTFVHGVDKIDVPDALLPVKVFSTPLPFGSVSEAQDFLKTTDLTYDTGNVAYFTLNDGKSLWLIDTNGDNHVQFSGANADTQIIINSSVTPFASDFV